MGEVGVKHEVPTSVKICGLSNPQTVHSITHLPIDQIGFLFAQSKRQVSAELAAEMIAIYKNNGVIEKNVPEFVGVFVNPTRQQLIDTIAVAPLDIVQLHSEASVEECRWIKEDLKLKVYKVVSISETSDPAQHLTLLQPYVPFIEAILLDTYDPLVGGGTGLKFTWSCIPHYLQWTRQAGIKLIVAGGLNADNVRQLIADYHPDGVDVSSGVETNGIKDAEKIKLFVDRVKG